MPDFEHTDRDALDDGDVVDLIALGVRVHWNGRPITRMTIEVFGAFGRYIVGGTDAERVAALQALLGFALGEAKLTAKAGEPPDYIYATEPDKALDGRQLWLAGSDDGWVVMFPGDW